MATKPTKYPRWANIPTVDPVYGGPNVIEPAESKKDVGWIKEFPPNQYFNWLFNLLYQWVLYFDEEITGFTTGDIKQTIKFSETGWVHMNDGTIGNAASSATTRANADTEDLFTMLWDNVIDTWAPVPGGRGASAAADYAANKTITILTSMGCVLGNSGDGATTSPRVLGEKIGTEFHQLTVTEMPGHLHGTPFSSTETGLYGNFAATTDKDFSVSTTSSQPTKNSSSTGGDVAHPNIQPTIFLKTFMKL